MTGNVLAQSPNPEQLSPAAQLTLVAEGIFRDHQDALLTYDVRDGSPVTEAHLAVVDTVKSIYTGFFERRLVPCVLTQTVNYDHSINFNFSLARRPESATIWDSKSDQAQTELYGVGAQRAGRHHPMSPGDAQMVARQMQNAEVYNPNKQIVVRGLHGDRVMGTGILGRLARLAVGIRKVAGGDLNPLTYE